MDEIRVNKIRAMEERFNRLTEWLRTDDPVTATIKEDAGILDEYCRSEWKDDYEADEKGEFPDSLLRGVLSQDALYDALKEYDERNAGKTMTYEEAVSLIPCGRYRHFKGNEYEVIGIARHSETCEPMVVYRALYGSGELWIRPASMWNETVNRDGKIYKRFEKTDDV